MLSEQDKSINSAVHFHTGVSCGISNVLSLTSGLLNHLK